MKILKASLKLYVNHFISLLIFLIIIVPMYGAAAKNPKLFSAITAFIYIAIAYGVAWNTGAKDSRKIDGYYPSWGVPAAISAVTAVVPIVLLVLYIAVPDLWYADVPFLRGDVDFFIGGVRFRGTPDFIFRMWYVHFAAFIPNGNIFAYVFSVFILPIIIYAGYGVGLTRFKIFEFLYAKLVFANDPQKGRKKGREDNLRR